MQRIKHHWLFFLLFLVVLLWVAAHIPPCDPLKNWNLVGDISNYIDPHRYPYPVGTPSPIYPGTVACDSVIINDVTNFLQTYPEKGHFTGDFRLYENGNGEHAVGFVESPSDLTLCQYALFYDKENKRVKVIKFGTIHAH